jgi:uncharacterized protein (DUF2141 family)
MGNRINNYSGILALLFCWGCAQQVAPTGGARDVTPPAIVSMEPPSAQTNFTGGEVEVEVEFDEFVQLRNLDKQLLASPPLKHKLKNKLRGKRFIFEVEDTLKPNTTYHLNFGDAIVDLHEGNPTDNFEYVFSTGPYLDSMSLSGTIHETYVNLPPEPMTVMLYRETGEDSLPYLQRPDYVSKTDKEGNYTFSYLKPGSYKWFAVQDKNDDYKYGKADGLIAFVDTPIVIDSSKTLPGVYAFSEAREKQYLDKVEQKGPVTLLRFNLPIYDSLRWEWQQQPILYHYQPPGSDSLLIWWKDGEEAYGSTMILQNQEWKDTVDFKIDTLTTKKLTVKINGSQPFFSPTRMEFNYPVDSINEEKIQLLDADTNEVEFTLNATGNPFIWQVQYPLIEGQRYAMTIDSTAIYSIYETTNDSNTFRWTLTEEKQYGNLQVKVEMDTEEALVMELLKNKKVINRKAVTAGKSSTYPYLQAGEYQLRLIVDKNKDGEWTTGDYLSGRQAEPAIIYNETLTVRANWDKEIEWVIE